MLESFSSLPSIFEFLVLGKDTKNTAEHVIMKKSLFTHARVFHDISIGNSMICNDIWHKYHEWYLEIVIRNFPRR